jgi:uncharacterized protein (DUF608 family)
MAGSFTREDFDKLVPADKKLSADWVESLFERGRAEVLRGRDLQYIGMPVGGIGAGQLYLGGDGRLWHWDIFNKPLLRLKADGLHYREPLKPDTLVRQRFLLKIGEAATSLDSSGFSQVSFRGEYPIGIVEYSDPKIPIAVRLEAFSPFIPLSTDDSSLPATILQFTLRNTSAEPVAAMLLGELENAVCLNHRDRAGTLHISIAKETATTMLVCSAKAGAADEKAEADALEKLPGYGTTALAVLGNADETSGDQSALFAEKLHGTLGQKVSLAPDESKTVTFILAWHFPNLTLAKLGAVGRHYATRFSAAQEVAGYVANNLNRLTAQTKLWRDTWYDSTLPFWFLDRTMLNTSILATSTCYRFADGRFYGWEGVGCCEGTCGHVYHYAHAAARLFPELERGVRERVDFGLALQPDGAIHFRGECNKIPAVDGQAGTILRALREHQMCADNSFLKRNWPQIKRATQWLIAKDANADGLIESNQHNTLDTDWFGPVAWLSGLYLAALSAAAQLAEEAGDGEFSDECRKILAVGPKNLVEQLFDGDYFINRVDAKHLDAINSGTGCEIDQVFGQSWAFQVGLPRVLPEKETLSALKSLWRYNFTPDVGPYREAYKPGRWYALAGEAGLLMCTFPRSDWDFAQARGKGKDDWAAGYFNECMNGFEYQVAGHMIWEGMVMEGLAITRAIHDRYHATRRNPWNEIECGDHYARSMASYGVYLAACGFEYHGPKQHIGFAPRLTPENFKCAFTSAAGWGSFAQRIEGGRQHAELSPRWGKLTLRTIALQNSGAQAVKALAGDRAVAAQLKREGKRLVITLDHAVTIAAGETLKITLS